MNNNTQRIMAFAKKLVKKVKGFAKSTDKALLKRRQRKFRRDRLKLLELEQEAKIEQQRAKIRKAKGMSPSKSRSSLTQEFLAGMSPGSAQKSAMPPKNPFGGALGVMPEKKSSKKKKQKGKSITIQFD